MSRILGGLKSLGISPSAAPVAPKPDESSPVTTAPGIPALPGRTVGIDLGTTFSCVAFMDLSGQPVAVSNCDGDRTTPSVVRVEDDRVVTVGKSALRALDSFSDEIALVVKRDMGYRLFHKPIRGRQFPPEVLSALILRKLKLDAEATLGPVVNAVVTVPAYFDETRRRATMDAAQMAGLHVLEILNEPTAAALAFAWRRGHCSFDRSDDRPRVVVVYDLGGGTFDCSVVQYHGTDFCVLATDGDVQLGGYDWDHRLVDFVADAFRREHQADPREDPSAVARLWRECESGKRTLSSRSRALIPVDCQGQSMRVEVTQQKFEELTLDLLDRTRFTLRQTLLAAGLEWPGVDSVLLVGGSTRMPMIRNMIREISGKEPDASVPCDEAVAQGAAIRAAILQAGDRVNRSALPPRLREAVQCVDVKNVISHSLGIEGRDKRTGRLRNSHLIMRNTLIPVTAVRRYPTQKDHQQTVSIVVLEGESASANDCQVLGRFVISELPPGLPAGSPIEVKYHVDANGRLNVEARDLTGNSQVSAVIERNAGLSQEQIADWTKWVASLEL